MLCGKGRIGLDTYQDLVFKLLITLKHGGEWTFYATSLKLHFLTFERAIMRLIAVIVGDFGKQVVVGARDG